MVKLVSKCAFAAHSFVLSARSALFETIFATELGEDSSSVFHLTDPDAETVSGMLEWMYARVPAGLAGRLLYAADKYQISGLKTVCEDKLERCLTVETSDGQAFVCRNGV